MKRAIFDKPSEMTEKEKLRCATDLKYCIDRYCEEEKWTQIRKLLSELKAL